MAYSFAIHGHPNVLATHRRTLEFTKDSELTKNGDCIVGVRAGFELEQLKKFLNCKKVKITISVESLDDTLTATPNPKFNSSHELVIRLGDFDSERTFATRADRASSNLDRNLIEKLKKNSKGLITILGTSQ